ncbi:S-protein homolog 1-like [Chenopodium quinoa]|uniref:S-protein homolog 1-like n=1 Tax=Chenopodium quinoa TaxID=63459 RepID=UPI000B77C363|nr:S-protein homolog 1-like [Chenopodium quinoa]
MMNSNKKSPTLLSVTLVCVFVLSQKSVNCQQEYTVHVINQISSESVTIHCQSKDDDLGSQTLAANGGEFHWTFKVNVPLTTLYSCDATSSKGHAHFDAFHVDAGFLNKCDGHKDCTWHALDNGINLYNAPAKADELVAKWES